MIALTRLLRTALQPALSPKLHSLRIPVCGVLLALIYLPTLATRFDFIDDGNLVYASAPMSFSERLSHVQAKIVANYEHLGPYRPVLWVHWELAAEAFQNDSASWRLFRFAWCAFAATMLLALFAELGIAPLAAFAAGIIAMGNPYRNEIWTSLTLSEGVAMPYALLALICACRAARSSRPLGWDLLGFACVLAALGCKNTFAALVPAQIFLRLAPDTLTLREGVRRHGVRAALLSLTLIAPVAHLIYFKLHWHPGQYVTVSPGWTQIQRIASSLAGGLSLFFVGPGLLMVLASLSRGSLGTLIASHRAALGAGVLLLLGGVVMYLPMDAMSGRYTMPAIWGLDLIIATLLTGFLAVPATRATLATKIVLALGLVAVIAASIGKQEKFAARAQLFWSLVENVERNAPPNSCIAWMSSPQLNIEEGIHVEWHLRARGRDDLRVVLYDETGRPKARVELEHERGLPTHAVWTGTAPAGWKPIEEFSTSYWLGRKQFHCTLGMRE